MPVRDMKNGCKSLLMSLTERVGNVVYPNRLQQGSSGPSATVVGIGMSAETALTNATATGGRGTQASRKHGHDANMRRDAITCSAPKDERSSTWECASALPICGLKSMPRTVASANAQGAQSVSMGTLSSLRLTMSTMTVTWPEEGGVEVVAVPRCTDGLSVMDTPRPTSCSVSPAIWAKLATAASAHISTRTVHRLGLRPVPRKRLTGEAHPSAAFTADEDIVSSAWRHAAVRKGGFTGSAVNRTPSHDGANQLWIYAGMIGGLKKLRFMNMDYATVVCSTWGQPTQPALP